MILWTVSTVGARFLRARDFEITYLCSSAYSRAEMVYRRALRRMGSEVELAVTAAGVLLVAGLLDGPAREAITN
jgi:hypothetical protein